MKKDNSEGHEKKEHSRAKETVKAVIEKGVQGVKKAMEALAAIFTHGDSISNLRKLTAEELARTLAVYFNGREPELSGLELTESDGGGFNVSGRAANLHSVSGVQEAELLAEMELCDTRHFHVPVPGAYGIDAFPATPIAIYEHLPRVKKITLSINSGSVSSQMIHKGIREHIEKSYPHARLLETSAPPGTDGQAWTLPSCETLACERFIAGAFDPRGTGTKLLKLIAYTLKKEAVDKKIDECLFIKDYEFRVRHEEVIFSAMFPHETSIRNILKKEKKHIYGRAFPRAAGGLYGAIKFLFFRIRKPLRSIEPSAGVTETQVSFTITFDCVTGLGPFSRSVTVSTVFFYNIDSYTSKSISSATNEKEKTFFLRYQRHDDFVVNP